MEKPIVLLTVYRSPSSSDKDFVDEFAFLLISLDKFSVKS